MSWRLRLDVDDDQRPRDWRSRVALVVGLVLASVWLVLLAVLAAWLAQRVG